MMNFIDKHKVLFIYQYGFRRNHSTSLALIDITDKIKFAINYNEYALGILLDITKAFDSINHDILLSELEHYGFRGHSLLFLEIILQTDDSTRAQTIANQIQDP